MPLEVQRNLPSVNCLFHQILVTVHQKNMFFSIKLWLTEEVFVATNKQAHLPHMITAFGYLQTCIAT
jgi:hypothetical protein